MNIYEEMFLEGYRDALNEVMGAAGQITKASINPKTGKKQEVVLGAAGQITKAFNYINPKTGKKQLEPLWMTERRKKELEKRAAQKCGGIQK